MAEHPPTVATTPLLVEALQVRAGAEKIHDRAAVDRAIRTIAQGIAAHLAEREPIVLTVMTGGMWLTGQLLGYFDFPLQLDYVHLSRYGAATHGGEITWHHRPTKQIAGRDVLLVDDLLDHGVTLQAVIAQCETAGAHSCTTAVLVVKKLARRIGLQHVDFHGLEVDDRYIFGCGMDYKGYWRNIPEILAVAQE